MRGRGVVWLDRLARWAIAAIFLAAAWPKIMDPSGFASDISHFDMVPDALVNLMAITLPWVEAVAGLALLSGFAADGALLLVNGLFVMFLVALGQAWARGLDINCGCFGHSEATDGNMILSFFRDIGFLALGAAALWLRRKRLKLDNPIT
jgi:putative oxidoreductase